MGRVFFILILIGYACGVTTDEEYLEEFRKNLIKCSKEHPVEMEDLIMLKQNVAPTKMKTKCLLGCVYKTMGYLNNIGRYDLDRANEIVEITHEGHRKKIENGKKVAKICSKVNKMTVSDGIKGCDRAALLFKCLVKNFPKYGFKI